MRITSARWAKLATVHQGVRFEQRTHGVLHAQLSMSLTRIGGKSDGGVDLQGDWWLPPPADATATPTLSTGWTDDPQRRRLRVLVQCKAEKTKLGPNYIREMEGVMLALHDEPTPDADPGTNASATVAILASESSFTRAGLERARQSRVPFFLMHLPPVKLTPDQPDAIGGCVWNPALVKLLGSTFELRWEHDSNASVTSASGRPGVWWNGKRLKSWTPQETCSKE